MWKFVLVALVAIILPISMAVADEQAGTVESVTTDMCSAADADDDGTTTCSATCGIIVPTSCTVNCTAPLKARCFCAADPSRGPGTWDFCVCE